MRHPETSGLVFDNEIQGYASKWTQAIVEKSSPSKPIMITGNGFIAIHRDALNLKGKEVSIKTKPKS